MTQAGTMQRWFAAIAGLLACALVAGCGGDSLVADGGTSGTGISRGPVTAVSSITLNGRTLSTEGATVRVNGDLASLAAIEPGHVVRVEADFDARRAETIHLRPDVVGRVDAVSIAGGTGTLTVLGQPVVVETGTVIAGYAGAGAIAVGDRVQVSGLRSGEGDVIATRIEPAATSTDRIVGVMHSPGLAGSDTLRMGGITVDHSSASSIEFPGGSPTAGDRIAVAGRLASGVLEADRIEPHTPIGGRAGEFIEATGILDGVPGAEGLALDGVPLDLTDASVTGGSLQAGARVRVRGELGADGRIDVRSVRLDP